MPGNDRAVGVQRGLNPCSKYRSIHFLFWSLFLPVRVPLQSSLHILCRRVHLHRCPHRHLPSLLLYYKRLPQETLYPILFLWQFTQPPSTPLFLLKGRLQPNLFQSLSSLDLHRRSHSLRDSSTRPCITQPLQGISTTRLHLLLSCQHSNIVGFAVYTLYSAQLATFLNSTLNTLRPLQHSQCSLRGSTTARHLKSKTSDKPMIPSQPDQVNIKHVTAAMKRR